MSSSSSRPDLAWPWREKDALARGKTGRSSGASFGKLIDALSSKAHRRNPMQPRPGELCSSARTEFGIKVNTLGLSTQPAIVECHRRGAPSSGREREKHHHLGSVSTLSSTGAGFKTETARVAVSNVAETDAETRRWRFTSEKIEVSGQNRLLLFPHRLRTKWTYSSVFPVLKDHNLAGVSLGMKNFLRRPYTIPTSTMTTIVILTLLTSSPIVSSLPSGD